MKQAVHNLGIRDKYHVASLIQTLKTNQQKHVQEYEVAIVEYEKRRKELIVNLGKVTKAFVKSPTLTNHQEVGRAMQELNYLTKPVNESAQYDAIIAVFRSLAVGEIELDWKDANTIINDSYDWAIAAKTTNAFYAGSAR